jgi:hypothetical protein
MNRQIKRKREEWLIFHSCNESDVKSKDGMEYISTLDEKKEEVRLPLPDDIQFKKTWRKN